MAMIGYARVSRPDQNLDAQTDALTAAGCERVFCDKLSGKLERRPQFDNALAYLRAGDKLVTTKLDRLGRSTKHLITLAEQLKARGVDLVVLDQGIDTSTAMGRFFYTVIGAFAEFERELISERTRDGLAAARARGRRGGRKLALTPEKREAALALLADRSRTVSDVALAVGVSRATLYRHLGGDD